MRGVFFLKSPWSAQCMTIPVAVYRVDPPDDEQQACLKPVEAYY